NAYTWAVSGTTYDDVVQGGGPTCWVEASLAAATYRGYNLGADIAYLGNGNYRVYWAKADNMGRWSEDVNFTGALNPAGSTSHTAGESWVTIMQRGILTSMGQSLTSPTGGSTSGVMPLLTGHTTSFYAGNDITNLTAAVNSGKLVTALTNSDPTQVTGGLVN